MEASKPCPQLKWRLQLLVYVNSAGPWRGFPRRPQGQSGNDFKLEGVASVELRLLEWRVQGYF